MTETPAIAFESVTFRYPGAERPAIEDVTFEVAIGDRVGVIGPNGGGKSTLIKLALGLLEPQSGSIHVLGETPERARAQGLLAYVPQRFDAERALPVSVRQMIEMAAARNISWRRRTPAEIRMRVDEAIALVSAGAFADTPVGRLSGGQVQRALVARAVATQPKILALDEPTVGIDPDGQERLSEMTRRLHDDLGLTIITVTHDLRVVAASSDRIACLAGKLHFHDAPEGLTPQVLAEVFEHDVSGVFGDLHVDAHKASECGGHH